MANLGNFDATTVEPSAPRDFTPIPAGKYAMQIVASEMKLTNDGGGQYLSLEHEVIDGEHKGRKLWNNLNLKNPNPTTVEIAQRELSAICHATGKLHVADSEDLHFIPMLVTVRYKPAGPDKNGVHREAKNEIKGYEPMSGAARPAPVQATGTPHVVKNPVAPPTYAKTGGSAVPPWRKAKAG